jgi:hypothetical protein
MNKRILLGLLGSLSLSLLAACGSGGSSGSASVRFVNASPGYASLDLYVKDTLAQSGVAFGAASGFGDVSSGDVTTALTAAGSATQLLTQSRSLSGGKKFSIVAYGWGGALKSVALSEDQAAADSGKTSFSVLNTASDAGTLDVYLIQSTDDLSTATAVTGSSGVAGGSRSTFTAVSANTYDLWVTANGDRTDVRLHTSGLVLPSTGVVTLILTPTSGGVLVDGFALTQGGSLVPQRNTKARARVIGNMAGGLGVGVLANSTPITTDSSKALTVPVTSPAITPYILIDAGSVTLHTSIQGSSLADVSQTIAGGSDISVLVTGNDIGSAKVTVLTDDNRLPTTTTKYKIRLIHGSNVLSGQPLTLSVDLSDLITDQPYAGASQYVSGTASSSSEIDVSSLSSATPLFSLTSQPLLAQGVYTLFIYDNAAGLSNGKLKKER